MQSKHNYLFLILGLLYLTSCTISPKTISYGEDQCHACKMIISDKQFGAELVTTKGKVYKFDAIECLVPKLIVDGEEKYSYILVTDYSIPGKFIDAKSSSFLISKNLPSPMGGNLSAFQHVNKAQEMQNIRGGEIVDWGKLKSGFRK